MADRAGTTREQAIDVDEESDDDGMPPLELATQSPPGRPMQSPGPGLHLLRDLTPEGMLQHWVASFRRHANGGAPSQSHAPHTSVAGVPAGELEEAVEYAFVHLCVGSPQGAAAWASPPPSGLQFRMLVDPGLLGQLLWYRRSFGGFPSDLPFFADTLFQDLCPCYDGAYPLHQITAALAHLVAMGQAVRCRLVPYLMMYHLQEGRWPTHAQWSAFLDRFLAFERDPAQYYQDDHVHTPVRGLERLPVTAYVSRKGGGAAGEEKRDADAEERRDADAEELQCAMCFEDLSAGQSVVVLPACGHTFHAAGADCIGTTVLQWFMKEHTCPTCRTDVVV